MKTIRHHVYATSQCTMHEYMIKFKWNLLAVVSPDEPILTLLVAKSLNDDTFLQRTI